MTFSKVAQEKVGQHKYVCVPLARGDLHMLFNVMDGVLWGWPFAFNAGTARTNM